MKSSAALYEDKQNGYILFKNGSENKNIIYGPLAQYTVNGQSQMDMTTQMTASKGKEGIIVSLTIDENILNSIDSNFSVHLDPSFEVYLNKMPDSTAYSKHDVNNYLANYAVIGNHPEFGEGWHYLRFRLNWFMMQPPKNLLSAKYVVKNCMQIAIQ